MSSDNLAGSAIDAIHKLHVPQGPLAGEPVRLASFQRQFLESTLAGGIDVGCLSVGRGNAKTALAAAVAVTHLIGAWGKQPQREILLAARTRDQAAIAFNFAKGFLEPLSLPVSYATTPHYRMEFQGADGPHLLRVVPSTGKSVLGAGPTLAILDERAAWMDSRGDELEAAILTSLGKRGGRAIIISTSAPDDANPFSRWLDTPPVGTYVQEHRADPGLPADDWPSLLQANPGCPEGIGATKEWLLRAAASAMERGGTALAHYRNLHRNERINTNARTVLIELDDWMACEVDKQPPREGEVVIGLDLGGAASMTAAAFFWPQTGRLECLGWFPGDPSLAVRGVNDGVGRQYVEMAQRGELRTLGERSVPVAEWIAEVLAHVQGQPIACILGDRWKQAEVGDALDACGSRAPVLWRGFGWRDGSQDIDGFRRVILDRRVSAPRSLLLRSALSYSVTMLDPAGNAKLAKGKANGRVDAAAATILALSEGERRMLRPVRKARGPMWA